MTEGDGCRHNGRLVPGVGTIRTDQDTVSEQRTVKDKVTRVSYHFDGIGSKEDLSVLEPAKKLSSSCAGFINQYIEF